MNYFEKAREFVYRNARPVDLARWKYHFEDGSRDDVLNALTYYQNEDGGFGHGLEPDCWNPNSSPIQTWTAVNILQEIGLDDSQHPVLQGLLKYLGSGADFADGQWLNTVPSNNDYPHAIWWEHRDGAASDYNPTASLVGFVLRFSSRDSELYQLGRKTAREAVAWYMAQEEFAEPHVLRCFVELLEYCRDWDVSDLFDVDALEAKLRRDVHAAICHDTVRWTADYVCKPSQIFNSSQSVFYADNKDTADFECEYIKNSQSEHGSYPVTWLWHNDYKEFEIAANWWRSIIIMRNFLYLRGFGKL